VDPSLDEGEHVALGSLRRRFQAALGADLALRALREASGIVKDPRSTNCVMVTVALWPLEPGRVEARGMVHVRANPRHGIPGDQGGQPLNHWPDLQAVIEVALAKKGQTLTQPDEWREIKKRRKEKP
jgi:hypothetical protein